jgi:hypothetical protein
LWVRILLRRGGLYITLCDEVCHWLATGRWFSPDTLVSSTYKTDRHDIAEMLLKVVLNTITLTPFHHRGWHIVIIRWSIYWLYYHFFGHPLQLKIYDKSIIKTAMLLFIYRYRKSLQIIFKRWRNLCVEYIFTNKEFWSNMVYAAVCKYSLVIIGNRSRCWLSCLDPSVSRSRRFFKLFGFEHTWWRLFCVYLMMVILSVPDDGYTECTWWWLFWVYLMMVILSVPDDGYSERTWWRLFQKRVVCTKCDIYVFIINTMNIEYKWV